MILSINLDYKKYQEIDSGLQKKQAALNLYLNFQQKAVDRSRGGEAICMWGEGL